MASPAGLANDKAKVPDRPQHCVYSGRRTSSILCPLLTRCWGRPGPRWGGPGAPARLRRRAGFSGSDLPRRARRQLRPPGWRRRASARAGRNAVTVAAARVAGQPAARRWRTAARLEFESRANQAARVNQPVSESSKSTWETDSDSRAFPPTRRGRRIGPIIRVGVGAHQTGNADLRPAPAPGPGRNERALPRAPGRPGPHTDLAARAAPGPPRLSSFGDF